MSREYCKDAGGIEIFLAKLNDFREGWVIETYPGSFFEGSVEYIEKGGEVWVKIHAVSLTGDLRVLRESIAHPLPVMNGHGPDWSEVNLSGVRLYARSHPETTRLRDEAKRRRK